MKSFGVRFYRGVVGNGDASGRNVSDLLTELANYHDEDKQLPQLEVGQLINELRELAVSNTGSVIQGVLALVRDDAPHIRQADGRERPIVLQEQEGVLEKNYFLYFVDQQLLVWQVNGRASHISRFERYLTELSGLNIKFLDILQEGAFKRIKDGMIKSLRFRVAKRKNAEAVSPDDWESDAFEMMSSAEATIIDIKVSTRRRSKGLLGGLSTTVHRMLNRDDVSALQVQLNGEKEPIDLLADCITDRIQVEMHGHYPVPKDILHQLSQAKDRQKFALEAVLGAGDKILE